MQFAKFDEKQNILQSQWSYGFIKTIIHTSCLIFLLVYLAIDDIAILAIPLKYRLNW